MRVYRSLDLTSVPSPEGEGTPAHLSLLLIEGLRTGARTACPHSASGTKRLRARCPRSDTTPPTGRVPPAPPALLLRAAPAARRPFRRWRWAPAPRDGSGPRGYCT